MSEERNENRHRHPKRTRQACLNCRRKKVRCPGELPICSFCDRLGQQCQYASTTVRKSNLSPSKPMPNNTQYSALITRISLLEEKLQTVSATRDDTFLNSASPLSNISTTALQQPWPWQDPSIWTETSCEPIDQSLSWTIHPLCNANPASSEVQSAVDNFFLHSHNQPYSFFNESKFRDRLSEGTLPDYLVSAVVATAARFSDSAIHKTAIGLESASRSWKTILKHIENDDQPSLSIIQATTLLAIFDFTACKNHCAWRKLGIAARLAQEMELMFEPHPSLPFTDQEERRRTFWSIYLLDTLITCGRARPPIFQEHFCKLHLPSTERAFRDGIVEMTGTISQVMHDTNLNRQTPAPFARLVIIGTLLAQCTRYILQDVNMRPEKPPWNAKSDYAAISSTSLHLEAQLEFRRPLYDAIVQDCWTEGHLDRDSAEIVVFSYALYHLSQCLLNHHFLFRRRLEPYIAKIPPSFLSQASATCLLYAQLLTDLLRDARTYGCQAHSSFYGFCAMVSGTVNALHSSSDDVTIQQDSIRQLASNIQFLQDHARYWGNSRIMLNKLQRFRRDANAFHMLIVPSAVTMEFSPANTENLYNLLDYSALSQDEGESGEEPFADDMWLLNCEGIDENLFVGL